MKKRTKTEEEAIVKLVKLYKCLQVVEYKFKGLPVDDQISKDIKRDIIIVMDAVDDSLKENFYVRVDEKDNRATVNVIDKTTEQPATGERIFEVLKESVEKNEEK